MISKRSKATDIPYKVKQVVYERDGGLCIYCKRQGMPNAHYISRAKGGLGIEQNVVTLCIQCHHDYDNGKDGDKKRLLKQFIENYLKDYYKDWTKEKITFKKGS